VTQGEVIEFLERQKEPRSAKVISEEIKVEVVLVHHALKKLLRWKEVEYIELDRNISSFYQKRKVNKRTCFFFIPGKINPTNFEEQVRVRFQSAEL
jgi:hypothetical protein